MEIFDFFKRNSNQNGKTASQRKKETEEYLSSIEVPFIEHLPMIEEESELRLRTPQEVAKRILILTYLNYYAEVPDENHIVIDFLKENNLWDATSPVEQKQLILGELSKQEKIDISWRTEGTWLLLWSLGYFESLQLPIEEVEIPELLKYLPKFLECSDEFIANAKLRNKSEILDMSDLIYRIHWATRNAYKNGDPMPANLNNSIVEERHYAINWLTYYSEDWDNVTTDT